MTADETSPVDDRSIETSSIEVRPIDAGFTLTELVIVVFLMGLMFPVLAMAFVTVIRTTPSAEDRADDSRSLLNLTTWLSQDVSSTAEDGFFVGAGAPTGGCLASSLPNPSVDLLELHWREGTQHYVANYRWLPTGPSKGQIFRYACMQGEAASAARMTPELNSVATGSFGDAPVEIKTTPTTTAGGAAGIKGLQFVVLIYDDHGVQRELLSLDAATTNVATILPGETTGPGGVNTAPTANDMSMTITPPATQVEELQVLDPDGDALYTTFPNGLPGGWDIRAVGVRLEVTPEPAAAPGDYDITYRVTDPSGEWAQAILKVTIAEVTPNLAPTANAVSITASKGEPSVATLVYSDPEGETLTPVLEPTDIPAGWTATVDGNQVTVTPSSSASGSTVIRYSVTDTLGAKATSQITVNVCTVTLVSVSPSNPPTVGVRNNGGLGDSLSVEISSNGACLPLVLGFLPNDSLAVEDAVSFNASSVATINKNGFTWTRPALGDSRVVALNVRQGANGPVELSIALTTTHSQG